MGAREYYQRPSQRQELHEEARKLVESDPAVKTGRLRVELHPWWGTTKLRDIV